MNRHAFNKSIVMHLMKLDYCTSHYFIYSYTQIKVLRSSKRYAFIKWHDMHLILIRKEKLTMSKCKTNYVSYYYRWLSYYSLHYDHSMKTHAFKYFDNCQNNTYLLNCTFPTIKLYVLLSPVNDILVKVIILQTPLWQ